MAGPPPSVKIASPIPTQLFSPVPNLGTAIDNLRSVPMMFQQHTGSPNMLPPSVGWLSINAVESDLVAKPDVRWWQPVWHYLTARAQDFYPRRGE